jgi:hypothetical protein
MLSITLAVVVQAGLILWLAERPRPLLAPSNFPATIHLAVDAWSAQRVSELPELIDPTVFALPGHHGFSGRAWLRFTAPQYQLTDWSEPNRWLELDSSRLGETFSGYVAANRFPPLRIADKPAPKLPLDELTVPSLPIRTNSGFRILGDLAQRPLLAPPQPPSWPHSEILNNTEVQVLVNGDGFAVSTVLLVESGSREADQRALDLARGARFAPLRDPAGGRPPHAATLLTRGRMVFLWHTLPLAGTNAPRVAP